ncbi:hypothetical protein ACFPK9_08485 [Rubritalea spongiae]|uniref:Uncharacterized protein n=1 Tax=Rubritalea spongiae TaxID=430797 RepID=A0ABW5E2M9_9BACT
MTTLLEWTKNEAAVVADEVELLVELTVKETIGPGLLVRNLLPILAEEPGLLVDVVLQLTNPNRDYSVVALEDYKKTYAEVLDAPGVRAREALLRALEDSAKRAGYAGLTAEQAA